MRNAIAIFMSMYVSILALSGCASVIVHSYSERDQSAYAGTALDASIVVGGIGEVLDDGEEDWQDVDKKDNDFASEHLFPFLLVLFIPIAIVDLPFTILADTVYYVSSPENSTPIETGEINKRLPGDWPKYGEDESAPERNP